MATQTLPMIVWTPSESELGSINENVSFSHEFNYSVETAENGIVEYDVTIVPAETNPSTISVTTNFLSGYYVDSFPISLQYMTKNKDYVNVEKFGQVNTNSLEQMIYYHANLSRTKIYTYTAFAKDISGNVVAQKVYTKTVQNDWTSGKNSLKTLVGLT